MTFRTFVSMVAIIGTSAFCSLVAQEVKREIKIQQRYLNLPVQLSSDRKEMNILLDGKSVRKFNFRLGDGQPDYWVYSDVAAFKGKILTLTYPSNLKGFNAIYQSDQMPVGDSLYKETKRPQFHFSSKRGWNNDPNGLVYYQGEYHLFYQHNPYEHNWENMHWGHAVSKDLVHWEEIGEALYPDELGTMFSGTAAIDFKNTSGFQVGNDPPLIAAYTAHKNLAPADAIEIQCIAYSNDKGRTFTKYTGNPVINSKAKWSSGNTRDPKIFWHQPSQKWVMVLYEKDGHSIYNSDNLKSWTFQSHIGGFFECPELFELPIDGNKHNTKWVMYGASGTYSIGSFDGREFKPFSGKHKYVHGRFYAAQTFNNIPDSDGRRIQIGWGQSITHGGKMPFGQMMLFPTQLTLRSTPNGVRLFNEPVQEIQQLHKKSYQWSNLTREEANEKLKQVSGDLFHIKMKVQSIEGTNFEFRFNGNTMAKYDNNHNTLNGFFFENENKESDLELLIDRTSVEIFAQGGAFTMVEALPDAINNRGLEFAPGFSSIKILQLEVHELKSIW